MAQKKTRRQIEVFADWAGLDGPVPMGKLYGTPSRGDEAFSFEYDSEWLKSSQVQQLDPSLSLYGGAQFTPTQQKNFGVFLDSAPDRWGRLLMRRREAIEARKEKRDEKVLLESDCLLGVHDQHRVGALRFALDVKGPFLDDNPHFASPPWTSLRELEQASLRVESKESTDDPEYEKWVKMLIAPGGSLGGARPKASVLDQKGKLWIAKFPSSSDEFDRGAWEYLAYQLAKKAGVITSQSDIRVFSGRHHTFLTKRFDRTKRNERLHFASAMTMLQRKDGDDASSGVSYLELAEFLIQHGKETNKDLEQLWRRIVFYICISNTDDHLRNHGFILSSKGWLLSPAFDVNPVEAAHSLKLNISDNDNSLDLGLAREVAEYFRVKAQRANEIIREVQSAVKTWKKVGDKIGIANSEQTKMKAAFKLA